MLRNTARVEYGSARWENKADIAPFMDPKPENNMI